MALNSSRSALSSTCKALRQCRPSPQPLSRLLSTQTLFDPPAERQERPRWSYTPERMKGPGFVLHPVKDPRRTIWHNNEDPELLDKMYNRLLGPNGEKMLPDETKWLAVTHKSFDQGRRGFNTRLAYFGMSDFFHGDDDDGFLLTCFSHGGTYSRSKPAAPSSSPQPLGTHPKTSTAVYRSRTPRWKTSTS
jgi:hypothetical protein